MVIPYAVPALLHRRERGRHEQLIDDVADDLAIGLGLGARLDPLRVALERRPLLLPLGKRFPCEQIGQLLIGFADQRGEKPGLTNAVLFPKFQRDGFKAFQQCGQSARHTAVDARFVDHQALPLTLLLAGSVFSQQSVRPSKAADAGHTSRDRTIAASMNEANSGCGSNGRDFSSGWNCTPMNQGWSSYSTISGRMPSGQPGETQSLLLEPVLVGGIDFIAMTMALRNFGGAAIDRRDTAATPQACRIGAKPHRSAEIAVLRPLFQLIAAQPFGHQADNGL